MVSLSPEDRRRMLSSERSEQRHLVEVGLPFLMEVQVMTATRVSGSTAAVKVGVVLFIVCVVLF